MSVRYTICSSTPANLYLISAAPEVKEATISPIHCDTFDIARIRSGRLGECDMQERVMIVIEDKTPALAHVWA